MIVRDRDQRTKATICYRGRWCGTTAPAPDKAAGGRHPTPLLPSTICRQRRPQDPLGGRESASSCRRTRRSRTGVPEMRLRQTAASNGFLRPESCPKLGQFACGRSSNRAACQINYARGLIQRPAAKLWSFCGSGSVKPERYSGQEDAAPSRPGVVSRLQQLNRHEGLVC